MAEIKKESPHPEPTPNLWARLRTFTPARIGLGRVGGSLPTRALLDFDLAHARARDAVHATFDAETLARNLREGGFGAPTIVASQALSRMEYLLRPDLGRALDPASRQRLQAQSEQTTAPTIALVIADGLSAIAAARHALPLLRQLHAGSGTPLADHWKSVRIIVANHARVALGDEIGQILHAQVVIVLIGERPGLTSPDSLGIYLTWAPRIGRTDAERNCISNVRPKGLPYPQAAKRLEYLLSEAHRRQLSGVGLKDDSEGFPDPRLENKT
ncbi:MAG TPA: ethanolamine ammonia-lyase subunit EutC [Acidobacteriaceae bacterium]